MADEEIREEVEEIEEEVEVELDPKDKQLQDKEQMIGRQSSEIGELRRQLEEAQQTAMMNQQQYPTTAPASGDPYEQVNSQFWDNPALTAAQMIQQGVQQALATSKMAQSNVKSAMSGLRSDPMFNKVVDEFEAELGRVDDQYFLNPQTAQATVEAVYERVVGKVARRLVKESHTDPTQRMKVLESLGVASPATSGDDNSDKVTGKDVEMLKALGITGKRQQTVVNRFTSKEEE